MSAKSVEWVLIIYYGKSAHRATYGRLSGGKYTKDYIQLSKKEQFLDQLASAFPSLSVNGESASITYKWPGGSSRGTVFMQSADRPHLAWDFNSAPAPWRMSKNPSGSSVETIRGDPTMTSESEADREFDALYASDFGQPYLVAIKLRGEPDALHLRVLISNPPNQFDWANLSYAPAQIQDLASNTSKSSALAWRYFEDTDESWHLQFDPSAKRNPWRLGGTKTSTDVEKEAVSTELDSDLIAEEAGHSQEEISKFNDQLASANYKVPDAFATTKTRGSAQRVFASAVKSNYNWRCALTGITTREFLVASHIVPWSVDEAIRLDPSNGICLSVLVDRAFELHYLFIEDDFTARINFEKISLDQQLRKELAQYDGQKLAVPISYPPNSEYLRRRREL